MKVVDSILQHTINKVLPHCITPNHLTIMRLLLVPPVGLLLWQGNYVWGTPLFLFAMFTDALDGALARTTNRITTFGKLMDPFADKLLIGTATILVVTQFVGIWLSTIIISIEMILIVSGMYAKGLDNFSFNNLTVYL